MSAETLRLLGSAEPSPAFRKNFSRFFPPARPLRIREFRNKAGLSRLGVAPSLRPDVLVSESFPRGPRRILLPGARALLHWCLVFRSSVPWERSDLRSLRSRRFANFCEKKTTEFLEFGFLGACDLRSQAPARFASFSRKTLFSLRFSLASRAFLTEAQQSV